MSQLFRISRITIFSKLKINESRTEIYEKSKEFRKKKKEKKKTNITTNFTFPVDKNKCILARRGTDPAQSHRINMSPDEPQRNILFFLSFFFAREGDEREREEWVCKKRTKEIERREEKRGKGQIEEGRDSLNLENRAQPHFRREGKGGHFLHHVALYPYRILSVCGSIQPTHSNPFFVHRFIIAPRCEDRGQKTKEKFRADTEFLRSFLLGPCQLLRDAKSSNLG